MARADLWAQAANEVGAGGSESDPWAAAAQEVAQETGQPTDYSSRRQEYIRLMKTDPAFRAKPVEERSRFLFPEEEKAPTSLKPWRGVLPAIKEESEAGQQMYQEGAEEFARPKSYLRTLTGVPLGKMAAGGLQSIFAPTTGAFSELVSRRLGNLARRLPVPDPESLGQVVEESTDIAGAPLIAKGAGALKGPLSRWLPTISEQVAAKEAEKLARLSASEIAGTKSQTEVAERFNRMRGTAEDRLTRVRSLAQEAQQKSGESYAKGMGGIRSAKVKAGEEMTGGIEGIESQLAGQQASIGLEAAKAGAPVGPKRTSFAKRYPKLEQEAAAVPIQPKNLNAKAFELTRETGMPGPPTHLPERSAAVVTRVLTEADPEEIAPQVQRLLTSGEASKSEITKALLGPVTTESTTMEQLLLARKRFREAERGAYKAKRGNVARQWGELEDAITQDMKELSKTDKAASRIYRQSRNLDRDYFKKKAADWYAEGIDDAFDKKTGVWDRKRFTSWWEDHADSTNNNKYLHRLLGDRYEQTQGLIEDMQKATELNIEQAASAALRNVRRTHAQRLGEIATQEAGTEKMLAARGVGISQAVEKAEKGTQKRLRSIGKFETSIEKRIQTAQANDVKAIEAETNQTIEEITGKPAKNLGHMMGSFMVTGGVHSMAGAPVYGLLTGNWPAAGAAIAGGAVSVAGGLFTLMHSGTLTRFMNTAKGSSIIARLTRATPGTAQAVAASHAAVRYAQELERTAEQVTAPGEEIDTRPSNAKDTLMKKYGIR